MVTHKFRATLGKSKLVNRGERVLVCVSGSQSSVTLLHLVWTGLQQSTFKRLTLDPVIVHIDGNYMFNFYPIEIIFNGFLTSISESVLFDYPQNQQNRIKELFEEYGLPYHIVKFASILYSNNCLIEDTNTNQHNNKLKNIFNNICDLTLKEDMLMKLR